MDTAEIERRLAHIDQQLARLAHIDKHLARIAHDKQLIRLAHIDTELDRLDKVLARMDKETLAQVRWGRLDYPSVDIYLRLDSSLAVMRLGSCAKEPWTVNWIDESVGPGDVFYDIGANVGAYALIASWRVGEGGSVVAFEPAPATFSSLCSNIVLNECDNVLALPVALSNLSGPRTLSLSSLESGAGVHYLGDSATGPYGTKAIARQRILTWRLDELVRSGGIPPPTHIKLDVDGAELEVLAGAEELLGNPNLRSLLVEMDPKLVDDVTSLLDGHSFVLSARFDRTGFTKAPKYGLFERR